MKQPTGCAALSESGSPMSIAKRTEILIRLVVASCAGHARSGAVGVAQEFRKRKDIFRIR